jgi:hypothetical protein
MSRPTHRDAFGSTVGLLVFLGGVGLLLLTFKLCFDFFQVPPSQVLKLKDGTQMDVSATGNGLVGILLRIATLLLMSIIGSVIANRGIAMYTGCRAINPPASKTEGS